MSTRREIITLLGGAAAAWPLATHAQQSKHMRRVAALMPYTANDPQAQNRNAAFLQGLQQLGWTIGQNVQIDYRWSEGNEDDTRKYAAELVALAPDVIFTSGSAAIGPLRRATRTVPIVFVLVPDPVGAGFVDSLARPGGNITGFTQFDSPAEAHSPLVSRSLRNGAARKRIGDVRNCKSGATHRSIVFAAAIRPCTYKSAMSG